MKLKMMTLAVFVAGLGASFALANDGHGDGQKGNGEHGTKSSHCTEVHVRGTIAPQTLTVTADDKSSRKLNVTAGAQVVLQLGGAGQTVRVSAEACQVTVGTATQLQVKSLELKARTPKTETTTTTGATTTTNAGTTASH